MIFILSLAMGGSQPTDEVRAGIRKEDIVWNMSHGPPSVIF